MMSYASLSESDVPHRPGRRNRVCAGMCLAARSAMTDGAPPGVADTKMTEAPMRRVAARPVAVVLSVALALALLPGMAAAGPDIPRVPPAGTPAPHGTYAQGEIIVQFSPGVSIASAGGG